MTCNLIIDVKHRRKMCLNPNDVNKKDFYPHEIFDCFFHINSTSVESHPPSGCKR